MLTVLALNRFTVISFQSWTQRQSNYNAIFAIVWSTPISLPLSANTAPSSVFLFCEWQAVALSMSASPGLGRGDGATSRDSKECGLLYLIVFHVTVVV